MVFGDSVKIVVQIQLKSCSHSKMQMSSLNISNGKPQWSKEMERQITKQQKSDENQQHGRGDYSFTGSTC